MMGIELEISHAPELNKSEEIFSAKEHQLSLCCIQIQQHPSHSSSYSLLTDRNGQESSSPRMTYSPFRAESFQGEAIQIKPQIFSSRDNTLLPSQTCSHFLLPF